MCFPEISQLNNMYETYFTKYLTNIKTELNLNDKETVYYKSVFDKVLKWLFNISYSRITDAEFLLNNQYINKLNLNPAEINILKSSNLYQQQIACPKLACPAQTVCPKLACPAQTVCPKPSYSSQTVNPPQSKTNLFSTLYCCCCCILIITIVYFVVKKNNNASGSVPE
jgi:hypothetical protein